MRKRPRPATKQPATAMGEANRQPLELELLRKAAAGLVYPSESDAPFDVFSWPAATGGSAREQVATHARVGRQIDEVAVGTFFAELEGADDAARFRELRKALQAALTDLHVFRAGSVKVDVYLIGRTRSGAFAGLHTTSVET